MSNHNEIEFDVFALLRLLWRKKAIIIIVAIIFGAAGFLATKFLISPTYTSSTKIYVVAQQASDAKITTQDLVAGDYLVKDYSEIIKSTSVLNEVIAEENLSMTSSDLARKISVTIPTNTRIVTISVVDADPKNAVRLADAIRQVAAEKIIEITKVSDVTTMEEAVEPLGPSGPNVMRNTILTFAMGALVSIVLVFVFELLNDQVRKPEDIEEAMKLPLLAVVPDITKIR